MEAEQKALLEVAERGSDIINAYKEREGIENLNILGKHVCDQLTDLHGLIAAVELLGPLQEALESITDTIGLMSAIGMNDIGETALPILVDMITTTGRAAASAHHEAMHVAFQLGIAVALDFNMDPLPADWESEIFSVEED